MNVANPTQVFLDVVSRRRSMRDFKSDPVPREIIESVFGTAQRAPSNCNTQPWFVHVVTGETLEQLRQELPAKFAAGEIELDFPYDGQYEGVYKERQYASAAALYDSLGIARDQKAERNAWFMRNFSFSTRPRCVLHAAHRFWSARGLRPRYVCSDRDAGLTAHGLGSCPQTALAFLANVIRPALSLGDHEQLMFGMSFGYPTDTAVNEVTTERASLGDVVTFHC